MQILVLGTACSAQISLLQCKLCELRQILPFQVGLALLYCRIAAPIFSRPHILVRFTDGEMEIDANLVAQLSKDEVVRHITQVHHSAGFQAS